LFPDNAFAQSIGLSISPPLLEVMIKPGKSISQAFVVTNESDQDLYLKTAVVPFLPADEKGNIQLSTTDFWLPKYFSLANANLRLGETFLLKAGKSQQLVLKIAIPPKEQEQDSYFTFLVEQSLHGEFFPETGGQTLIKIGANILLTISSSGKPWQKGVIKSFLAVPDKADIFDRVEFKLVISNQGKSFFKSIGKIEIFDFLGKKKIELTLRPDNILVNSSRQIWCLAGESTTACQFNSFRPGRYRAVASFTPDGRQGEVVKKEVYFWLLPIKLGVAIIIMGLILFLIRGSNKF